MIRGVVTVFGALMIGLMIVVALYVGTRFLDWAHRRVQMRRMLRGAGTKQEDTRR